jgi:putative DNA primase/helicase
VLSVPDAWAVVSAPVLLAEDGAAPRARTSSGNGEFDLEAFLADNHLEVRKHKQEGGGDVWELAVCPFNADHDHGEAFVRRDADGTISAGCQHQTCFSSWEELRERYEPGYRQRQTTGVGTYEPAAAPAAGPAEGDPLVHEAAHAEVLMDVWRDEYRWAHHEGTWRHWTGRVWKAAAEPVVVAAAQKVLRRHYGRLLAEMQTIADDKRLHTLHGEACRYASVLGGLRFLSGEAGFHTAVEEWDADPYLLNCADGLLDLRTQTLGPHDAAALCTKIARWSFGGDESSGACQRHLQRCLPDADVRRQVQRDLGRALVGADLEESLPIWYGIGRNGKTTTARTVRHGLGEYGKKAAEGLLMARRNEQHPTEMAALSGARFVVSEEVEQGKRLNESRVKELTGGEPPQARFMHCDFFHLEQTFTIFLLVNHRPEIAGTDKGIWGRVRLVPWTVSIPFAEQRPMDEMVAELSADGAWMLRWMVAGFADWQAEPHWIAAEVLLATEEYRCEQDQLAGFLADACEEKPFATVVVTELHAAYASWSETAGEVVLGKIALGKAMRSRGFTQKKATGGTRVWLGIRLSGEKWQACSLSSRDDFSIAQPAELPLVATDDELAP